jgi:type I restriction enzyme R subunit
VSNGFSKHEMTEEDIKLKYITPAIDCKWDRQSQMRMEHNFTDGRVIVQGNTAVRGKRKKADYILYYKRNLPLAIVEAKDNKHDVGAGMQQAIEYAEILDIPFAYSSNGDAFLEHDIKNGKNREIALADFPTPEELWLRYMGNKNFSPEQEKLVTEPYFVHQMGDKTPRYYQAIAINRTIEAVACGQNRILLVMATGTGKTYTAFQIIHRLWSAGVKKKILYLADRNILIDQTMQQDFKPFEKIMTKISGKKLDSAYELYLSLYQQLAGNENEEPFREFKPDFFDLIVVDECHRGSVREESRWRKILEYFSGATHIGMTATPKETKDVSTTSYFGDPVYTYSLKQGIADGFLAPYKVIRVGMDVDVMGWRPVQGQTDDDGNEIEDREYGSSDYDKNIILVKRTKKVAERITKWLEENGRYSKSIVFCTGVNHAERMRQELTNLNSDLVIEDSRYVMQITGDDAIGKRQLDNFIDVESRYPVIATTSELLSTGVDCKTCKLIVLDNVINSMTKFKQIIGRGTRLLWDEDKRYFTILDFRNVTRLFADPDFDGDPVAVIEECEICGKYPCECPCPVCGKHPCECPCDVCGKYPCECEPELPAPCPTCGNVPCTCPCPYCGEYPCVCPPPPPPPPTPKVTPVDVEIMGELVRYIGNDGKLITESISDYSRTNILGEYATLEEFLNAWKSSERKQAIIDELKERGVLLEALREAAGNRDIDDFDLICHIAFDKKPLTKKERAEGVRKRDYLSKYEGVAREVLSALLNKYASDGITDIDDTKVLRLDPFRSIAGLSKIFKAFGGENNYRRAVRELENQIYALSA